MLIKMFNDASVELVSLFPITTGKEVLVSYLVWFLLLYFILPIFRYVIGLKYWRYSTVFMLSLSLWLFLLNFRHLWIGVAVWTLLVSIGTLTGILMYKYLVNKKVHYFVKVSLVSFNIMFGLAIVVWSVYIASGVSLLSTLYVDIAFILLFSALYELVVLFSRKGMLEFARRGVLTIVVALTWGVMPILGYGFGFLFRIHLIIVLITLALLLFVLARWRNLTFVEFFRFRKIVKESE